jgi:hypothetical protein
MEGKTFIRAERFLSFREREDSEFFLCFPPLAMSYRVLFYLSLSPRIRGDKGRGSLLSTTSLLTPLQRGKDKLTPEMIGRSFSASAERREKTFWGRGSLFLALGGILL